MITWTCMNIKGQSHSLTLVQSQHFQISFSLKLLGRLKPNFLWRLHGMGEQVWSNCHMTKMAAMPMYGKTLKKSSSQGPKGWWPWKLVCGIGYSSTTKIFKWWPWDDLDLFYGTVKFGPLCFCMGEKSKTMDFLRNYCSLWYKSW